MKNPTNLLALLSEYVPAFMSGSMGAGAFDRHGGASPSGSGSAVSVIPINGPLYNKSRWGIGMSDIRDMISQAADDSRVKSIILDIDSPGGTVDGTPETAQAVRDAAAIKPVIASVTGMAASAAYWIASNATKVFVSPSARVGSIGVFAAHTDFSEADKMMGVKTTLIYAGKFKVEGNPYEPLDDTALAQILSEVLEMYGMFVADVAKGRGVSVSKVKSDFGEGRMVSARDAVKSGMVDGIAPLEQIIANQTQSVKTRVRASFFDW